MHFKEDLYTVYVSFLLIMIAEALSIEKIFTIIKARYDEDLVSFQVHFLKI